MLLEIKLTSSWLQVVSETYEELVFSEPTEAFWRRAGEQGSLPAPEPQLSCSAYVGAFNPQVQSAVGRPPR
jgi:hypothetical protein